MKFNDAVWGVLLVVFGGLLFVHVSRFPAIPGQQVGPNALPGALAVGLAACGAVLFWRGLRDRRVAPDDARWVALPLWFRSAPHVVGFAVLVAVNVFYLLAVDRLGFVIVGTVYLAALMWVLRVKPWNALALGLVLTLLVHGAFYKLLKVPLPWGVLQGVAW